MVDTIQGRCEIEFEGKKILFAVVGVLTSADKMFCLSGGPMVCLESPLGITYHASAFSVLRDDAVDEAGPELVQIAMKGNWAVVGWVSGTKSLFIQKCRCAAFPCGWGPPSEPAVSYKRLTHVEVGLG